MTLTIILPDELAAKLQAKAETQQVAPEELVLDILSSTLELDEETVDYSTPEEVVAKIKATPPNPANVHPATESLADLLLSAPEDPDFDLAAWSRDWAKVEAEMEALTRANDIAEDRG
jgi:hypothetical protein